MTGSYEAFITGKGVFYLHSCPVLAWLYVNGHLVVSQAQEYIKSGKELDERRWAHKRSLDLSPFGKADWVTGTQSHPVIHEGSRSMRHSDPKRAQLKHYLWAARKLYGIEPTGELHLGEGRIEAVYPDDDLVEEDHRKLRRLLGSRMPMPVRMPICRGCSNKDWCWP